MIIASKNFLNFIKAPSPGGTQPSLVTFLQEDTIKGTSERGFTI